MSHSIHIVSLLLVLLMLGTGLPIYNLGDVSQDGRTDLQDVIISVKDLARTTEAPGALTANFKLAVTTLSAVAGLKTVIKPASDFNSNSTVKVLDAPYLKYTRDQIVLAGSWSEIETSTYSFNSITHEPTLPPPQIS